MAGLWVLTGGFVLCLGLVGGVLFYYLLGALNSEDSTTVDLIDNPRTTKE